MKIGGLLSDLKDRVEFFKKIANKKITDENAKEIVAKYIGPKAAPEILNLWTAGRGQNGDKTLWALYNGATQYLTDKEKLAPLPVASAKRTYQKSAKLLGAIAKSLN